MRNLIRLLSLVTILVFVSCKNKNVDCDATLCVINNRADTIWYCWGCNMYNEYIPPGGKACRQVGHIIIKKGLFTTEESTETAYFDTPSASYAIPVDECNEERIME